MAGLDWRDPARSASICQAVLRLGVVFPDLRAALLSREAASLWTRLSLASSYTGLTATEVLDVQALLHGQVHRAAQVAVTGGGWEDSVLCSIAAVMDSVQELHLLAWHDAAESYQLASHLVTQPTTLSVFGSAPVTFPLSAVTELHLELHPEHALGDPQRLAHSLLTTIPTLSNLRELSIAIPGWSVTSADIQRIDSWCPGLQTIRLAVSGLDTWPHNLRTVCAIGSAKRSLLLHCSKTTAQQALRQLQDVTLHELVVIAPALPPSADHLLVGCPVTDSLRLCTRAARPPLADWPHPARIVYEHL